jgi:hypothetical protein
VSTSLTEAWGVIALEEMIARSVGMANAMSVATRPGWMATIAIPSFLCAVARTATAVEGEEEKKKISTGTWR